MNLKFDDFIPRYPKINGIFKRDEKGNFYDEYSQEEFEYLKDCTWIGTEKIDGTNIRLYWNGFKFAKVMGRRGRSQIPVHLKERLEELCDELTPKMENSYQLVEAVLFGEGFGHKIQHGGLYLGEDVDFILFDVISKTENTDWRWLPKEVLGFTGVNLGIRHVPTVFKGNLAEAIEFVKSGFDSTIGYARAEGLVLYPECDLRTKFGDRIIMKIKTKDWKKK